MSPIMLTLHFSLDGTDGLARGVRSPIPPHVMRHLREMAELAEKVRRIVRAPMRVTNGYDAPDVPDPPGRVPSSQHKDGSAIDFIPIGISLWEFQKRFEAAKARGEITKAEYGELILYPFDLPDGKGGHGHVHLSLPTRTERGVHLVRINEDENQGRKYAALTASWLKRFPGATAAMLAMVLVGLLVYFLLFAPEISRHG